MFGLEQNNVKIIDVNGLEEDTGITYEHNGKKYYFKRIYKKEAYYNDIIAEKIAKRLGIPCCHHFLSTYNGNIGISSEMFDTTNYIPMTNFLGRVYPKEDQYRMNNFEDIWNALETKFDFETTERLMDELVNIFIFDILIGNPDRHPDNYGLIIEDNNVRWNPLFDNEFLLSLITIDMGETSLLVSPEDYRSWNEYVSYLNKEDIHIKFFSVSDDMYKERLRKMMEVISEESINEIFDEMKKEGTIIPDSVKEFLLKRFELNRKRIQERIFKNKVM